jgi:hypothetical protein
MLFQPFIGESVAHKLSEIFIFIGFKKVGACMTGGKENCGRLCQDYVERPILFSAILPFLLHLNFWG